MARQYLGENNSVVAKDTPAFIGNRIGIFSIQSLFHMPLRIWELTVEEVDKLTGPVIGSDRSRQPSEQWTLLDWTPWYMLPTESMKTARMMNGIGALSICPDFINTMMEQQMVGEQIWTGIL